MHWAQRKTDCKSLIRFGDGDRLDEEVGRIIDDEKYAQALRTRDDIFKTEKEVTLLIAQGVAMLFAIVVGIWLSSRSSPVKAAPDFFERIPSERMATLWRYPEPPDDVQATANPQQSVRGLLNSVDVPVDNSQKRFEKETIHQSPLAIREGSIIDTTNHTVGSDTADRRHVPDVSDNDAGDTPKEATTVEVGADRDPKSDDPLYAFRQTLEQNPRDVDALAIIGNFYFHTGLMDSAAPYYYRILAENPENHSIWNNLGSVHYYRSNMANNPNYIRRQGIPDAAQYKKALYDSATAAYTRAFSLDSSFVEALANRAVIHDIHGNHDQALLDYTLAISIDSACADAYRKRAGMHKRSGNYKKALKDYTAALRLDSSSYRYNRTLNYANVYFGRGVTYYTMGRYGDAVADFDSTLAIYPRHSLAILNKGISLVSLRRYEEAIGLLSMAVEQLSPTEYGGAQLTGFMHRGNAYKSLGMYGKAIADYERATSLSSLAARACWRIAQCHSLQEDYDATLLWLKKSVSHGFSDFHLWRRDRDLAPLSNTREFLELIELK